MRPRVLYMGTAGLACPPLAALHASTVADVVGVVTQPDRPGGRKLKPQPSPVKQCAVDLQLRLFQPQTLRTEEAQQQLVEFNADLFVVTAYGQILPQAVLDIPFHGALNIHASLLPRHRGAAPIQWTIIDGDTETGVTLMKMDAGLDTGDMVAVAKTDIAESDTAETLHDRLAELGATLLVNELSGFLDGTTKLIPQNDSQSTYAKKISKQDGQIDWAHSAEAIHRKLRALSPWPGVFTQMPVEKQKHLKILAAEIMGDHGRPGEIISSDEFGILVGCGKGALRLTQLQRESSRPMQAAEFLNGCPLKTGQTLG